MPTYARSFSGEYASLAYMCGLMPSEGLARSSVWPSGVARAAYSAPTLPPAPERFSTSTGWPSSTCRRGWIRHDDADLAAGKRLRGRRRNAGELQADRGARRDECDDLSHPPPPAV